MTECISSFKSFSSGRVLLECALIKLTSPVVNTDLSSVLSRISALENKIAYIEKNPPVVVKEKIASQSEEADLPPLPEPPPDVDFVQEPVIVQEAKEEKVVDGDIAKIIVNWNDVMTAITQKGQLRIYTALFGVKPQDYDGKLLINVTDEDKKRLLSDKASISFVKECIKEIVGIDVQLFITNDDIIPETAPEDDIFSSLGDMGKNFPSNIRID